MRRSAFASVLRIPYFAIGRSMRSDRLVMKAIGHLESETHVESVVVTG